MAAELNLLKVVKQRNSYARERIHMLRTADAHRAFVERISGVLTHEFVILRDGLGEYCRDQKRTPWVRPPRFGVGRFRALVNWGAGAVGGVWDTAVKLVQRTIAAKSRSFRAAAWSNPDYLHPATGQHNA